MVFPSERIFELDFWTRGSLGEVPPANSSIGYQDFEVACVERGDKHRWFTDFYVTFFYQGKFYQVMYMEPASESQDGQDRWEFERTKEVDLPEVFRHSKTVEVVTYEEQP